MKAMRPPCEPVEPLGERARGTWAMLKARAESTTAVP